MKKTIGFALASVVTLACTSLTPPGREVKVYQADVKTPETPAPPLPQGCKLVATAGPIDQQEQERQIDDPYRIQRNQTAAAGGNVLLVKSSRIVALKRTECAESDPRNCPDSSQTWYKVSFGSYACDGAALAALAESKPATASRALFEWSPKKKESPPAAPAAAPPPAAAPAPSASATVLKSRILALVQEGVGADVIVSYVRAHRPSPPLTAEEIIDWKKSGISEEVIRATFPN